MKTIEVIVSFSNGRIIPRRVRYYCEALAEYKVSDIMDIYYEERVGNTIRYSVKLKEEERDALILFSSMANQWFLVH